MREHKFKCWDVENKIMCQVYRLEWLEGTLFADCFPHLGGIRRVLNTKENPLTEYTDTKDKNGKEIYEGDRLKLAFDPRVFPAWTVRYDSGCFWVFSLTREMALYEFALEDIEIIGNVYESPELLEGNDAG